MGRETDEGASAGEVPETAPAEEDDGETNGAEDGHCDGEEYYSRRGDFRRWRRR